MSDTEPTKKTVESEQGIVIGSGVVIGDANVINVFAQEKTLREYLKEHGKLGESELLSLMKETFLALEYVHSKDIVYRDIKPENILISPAKKGRAIIALGLIEHVTHTAEGEITSVYLSPELSADARSDIYSLGVVLYEALAGQQPYQRRSVFQHLLAKKQPYPLSKFRPDISSKVAKAIERALEPDPKDRWKSVREFWFALTGTPLEDKPNQPTQIVFTLTDQRASDLLRLTPHYLATVVEPYLAAIVEIQKIIDEAKKRNHQEISIKSISQQSPISVSLDGASEAIGLIKDTIVPWRRKHSETMARLLEQEKQALIESIRADVLEKRAHAEKERMEAVKQRGEAEKLRLENEKLKIELERAKVLLAIELLNQIAPNLSEEDRIAYIVRMLPHLEVVIFSELEIVINK